MAQHEAGTQEHSGEGCGRQKLEAACINQEMSGTLPRERRVRCGLSSVIENCRAKRSGQKTPSPHP